MKNIIIFLIIFASSLSYGASLPVGGSTTTPKVMIDTHNAASTAHGIDNYTKTLKLADLITKGPYIDVRAHLPNGAVTDASVDYTSQIQAAVAAAYAAGIELYWPYVYLTSASIPDFHSVRHRGPGGVKRGSDIFYVEPTTTTNKLYAATTGSAANDGITSSQPISTFQGAIDVLPKYGPVLNGVWEINLAAGTYARGRFPDTGLLSENEIVVQGPDVGGHPNVPTALIKEGATQAAFGILGTEIRLRVKNVKIEDYNGSTSSSGIRVNRGEIHTENVHLQDCYYGVSGVDKSLIDIKGGIFDDCGYLSSDSGQGTGHAVRGLFHTKFEVGTQNAGDLTAGPIIRNSAGAARAQELVTGHWDWVTTEDCDNGLRLMVNSRLNVDGSSFKRIANSAIYATQGSHADPSANTVFGTGADANETDITIGQASSASGAAITDYNIANATELKLFRTIYPGTIVNSTSSSYVVDTLTLKAGAFIGPAYTGIPAKKILCVVRGTISGTTGTYKRLAIRLGAGIALVSFPVGVVGEYEAKFDVSFTGTGTQFIHASARSQNISDYFNSVNATETMTADTAITLNAFVQDAADSITINAVEWHVQGV